eukprot:TRINITY_DN4056_c0_g2_i12.p1 TRINITY_DN4056_c0_g2~~TRINITY_DN4056_c0_g2_i12.p1  ORF type:complete len:508 (+),score=87.77 TRINITY_DN4056_c0_g2_i12:1393-2916(+)
MTDVSDFLNQTYVAKNFHAKMLPSSYKNIYGQEVESFGVVGSAGISYPGAGGLVLTDVTYPECFMWNGSVWPIGVVNGAHGCMTQGSWSVETVINATLFQDIYHREMDTLALHVGVPSSTAMLQLGCSVVNTYEKVQAFSFSTIEFLTSGQVKPMEPRVVLSPYPYSSPSQVYLPLVIGLYILCEELQDLIVGGAKSYIVAAGWLNTFDWLALISLFLLWVISNLFHGVMPMINVSFDMRGDTSWTLALVVEYYHTFLGMACFCMIIKGLKFTNNIPIMCNISNTFSHSLVPVGLLLIVVFFLLFGFAVIFNLNFAVSQMNSFDDLGTSLFSVFRGLLGDIDTEGIYAAAPTLGPILFCVYVTVVLFVAFTILIAMICESFNAVSEDSPREGFVISALAWYQSRGAAPSPAEENQSDGEVEEDKRDVSIEMNSLASTPDPSLKEVLETLERQGDRQVRLEQHMVKLERLIADALAQRTEPDRSSTRRRRGSPVEGASDLAPDSLVTV